MRVLLLAYACEPGSGSEPGTGWNLANEIAQHHEVTLITRANNKELIEQQLASKAGSNLQFIYHDLPKLVLKAKRLGIIKTQIYYDLWQRSLATRVQKDPHFNTFDVVHHLTFNSFESPPRVFLAIQGKKIWGPIGGGQTATTCLLKSLSPIDRIREWLRTKRVRLSAKSGIVKKVAHGPDQMLFANRETQSLFSNHDSNTENLMIDVGVSVEKFTPKAEPGDGKTVLYAGRFEARKGVYFLIRAFQKAHQLVPELRLRMVGTGPEITRVRNLIRKLRLDCVCEIVGRVSHERMREEFQTADFLAFPSLRDTSGAIVLEAMASGLPVVAFKHQGAAIMLDESCGKLIEPLTLDQATDEFSAAIVHLAEDRAIRNQMGKCGRARAVKYFSWENKCSQLLKIYSNLTR